MKKIIIDMCSMDKIAKDQFFLVLFKEAIKDNRIKLLTMDVLTEQYKHEKVPAETKKLLSEIYIEHIVSPAFIWGISTWGSIYGDGSQTGVSVNQIMTKKGNNTKDAIIAVTANGNADYFITEDIRLTNILEKLELRCKVLNFETFKKMSL